MEVSILKNLIIIKKCFRKIPESCKDNNMAILGICQVNIISFKIKGNEKCINIFIDLKKYKGKLVLSLILR